MPTPPTRRAVPLLLLALVALLAASCSRSSDEARGPEGSTPGTDPGRPTVTLEPGTPARGGKLNVSIVAATDRLSPTTGSWSWAGYALANAVYDPLFALDPDGETRPYLAESATHSADFTEWTITLRPGVTFHDGTPVDAAAVAANFDAMRRSPITGPAATPIAAVETPDARTVVVRMHTPWSTFPTGLTLQVGYIVAPSMLTSPDAGGSLIVGSGPFKVVDQQPGSRLTVARNTSYWQLAADGKPLPYLDGIDFRVVSDPSSRISALQSRAVDATYLTTATELTAIDASVRAGDDKVLSKPLPESDEEIMVLNTTAAPFDDRNARLAVAYAIDRDRLASEVFQGVFPAAWGMFEEGSPWYLPPEELGAPRYDPTRARALAEQYQAAHGEPVRFRYLTRTDTESLAAAQAIQSQLADVGITMEIETADTATIISRVVVSGTFQASLFQLWTSPTPDIGYIFVATPANRAGMSLNVARLDDPELVRALDDYRASDDPARQKAAVDAFQRRVAEDSALVFVRHVTAGFAFAGDVHGVSNTVFPGTDTPAYASAPGVPFYTSIWVGL